MATVTKIRARDILDSRGTPTVEVYMETEKARGIASVPSGASVGSHEAHELRDGGEHFGGKGVLRAVAGVNADIAILLVGHTYDQRSLDAALIALDGTPTKSRLGANALLAVSLAFARASADEAGQPLYAYVAALAGTRPTMPVPCFNVLNGGKHADSGLGIQEFMLVPQHGSAAERIEVAAACIAHLREALVSNGYAISVGDEGGFAPKLPNNEAALDVLVSAITAAGYSTGDVQIAIDAAASSFFNQGTYVVDGAHALTGDELLSWYEELVQRYPICSIEDPFAEESWDLFAKLVASVGTRVAVVGDDLLTTNIDRMREAAAHQSVTSALIKPNQIGTLSETIDAAQYARSQGWALFASHRSGETTDTAIVDIAVGIAAEHLKAGSLARGERVCKYNRLREIAEELQ